MKAIINPDWINAPYEEVILPAEWADQVQRDAIAMMNRKPRRFNEPNFENPIPQFCTEPLQEKPETTSAVP